MSPVPSYGAVPMSRGTDRVTTYMYTVMDIEIKVLILHSWAFVAMDLFHQGNQHAQARMLNHVGGI